MKKTFLLMACIVFATAYTMAQSVDEGIKKLSYGQTKSATDILQNVVNKNSKDARAIYWLGQAMIANDDVAGAKALYQKALSDGINDAYILVGMGHVELLEGGDVNSAKQKFEQAITQSKNKKGQENPDILNAIGRANADGSSKIGDPAYAIEKLKRAAQLDTKNPDIDINLGVNYLKMGSDKGGEAVQAFQDAIARAPQNPVAYARIGRVYQSQNNVEAMNEWYNKAVNADASFPLVYYNWFDYYKDKDVNSAKAYLDNYVKNADKDCSTDYFQADYYFRAGQYQESLAKADSMAAGGCQNFPRLNVLYAYNYNRLNDSIKAKDAIQKFFATVPDSKIQPDDYALAGTIYKNVSGFEDSAVAYTIKAMEADTVVKNKQKYIDTIALIYKKANRPAERLEWRKRSFALNTDPSSRDFYDLSDAAIAAKDASGDSIITAYKAKFPDQVYPYTFAVKYAQTMDTTGAAAVAPINDYIGYLMKDTAKNGQTIAYYHALQGGYYANYAKNFDSAIYEFQQAVKFDPAQTQYQQYLSILEKAKNKANQPKSTTTKPSATKPKTGSGK